MEWYAVGARYRLVLETTPDEGHQEKRSHQRYAIMNEKPMSSFGAKGARRVSVRIRKKLSPPANPIRNPIVRESSGKVRFRAEPADCRGTLEHKKVNAARTHMDGDALPLNACTDNVGLK